MRFRSMGPQSGIDPTAHYYERALPHSFIPISVTGLTLTLVTDVWFNTLVTDVCFHSCHAHAILSLFGA